MLSSPISPLLPISTTISTTSSNLKPNNHRTNIQQLLLYSSLRRAQLQYCSSLRSVLLLHLRSPPGCSRGTYHKIYHTITPITPPILGQFLCCYQRWNHHLHYSGLVLNYYTGNRLVNAILAVHRPLIYERYNICKWRAPQLRHRSTTPVELSLLQRKKTLVSRTQP